MAAAPQSRVLPNAFADPPLLAGLASAPILSLVDAVQLTNIQIDQSCTAAALAHHRNMSPPDAHRLTPDEIAAFHLFTQDSPFFFELNSVLREMDRPRVAACLPYLRLLVAGMNKLPRCSGQVFRGIKTHLMDTLPPEKHDLSIDEAFPEGHVFLWWGVTTTYTSQKLVESFAGKVGRRTIFRIRVHSAVDAAPYSAAGDKEKEWTLSPGAQLRVVGSAADLGDVAMVELEEIGTPFSLAQFTAPSQALVQSQVPRVLVGAAAEARQPIGSSGSSPHAHAHAHAAPAGMLAEIRRHLMFLHSVPLVVRAGNAMQPVTQLDTAGEACIVARIC